VVVRGRTIESLASDQRRHTDPKQNGVPEAHSCCELILTVQPWSTCIEGCQLGELTFIAGQERREIDGARHVASTVEMASITRPIEVHLRLHACTASQFRLARNEHRSTAIAACSCQSSKKFSAVFVLLTCQLML